MSPNMLGALFMMASMASFVANDTLIKLTEGAVPLWQLLFLRGVLTVFLIIGLGLALRNIHFRIGRRDWGWIMLRSVSEIGAAYFFLTALLQMPLANVTAILQVLPLTVTLSAALFFSEPLGWRRLLAIAVGLVGMLLIVRPGTDAFDMQSINAIIAVVFVTLRDLATRKLSPDVPSMTVTLAAAVVVMLYAAFEVSALGQVTPFAGDESWAALSPRSALLIAGASVFIIGGYFFSVQVMRLGDVSFTALFRYSSLVFALIAGWLVFGEWPDRLTLLGALIIAATGLFTLWREGQMSRR